MILKTATFSKLCLHFTLSVWVGGGYVIKMRNGRSNFISYFMVRFLYKNECRKPANSGAHSKHILCKRNPLHYCLESILLFTEI